MSKARGGPSGQSLSDPNFFPNIFEMGEIELANEQLRNWKQCFAYVSKLLHGKLDLSSMTKVIQQEIISTDKNTETNQSAYSKIQTGLFYLCVVCEEASLADVGAFFAWLTSST